MKSKLNLLIIFLIILGFFPPDKLFAQCTNCDGTVSGNQNASSAIGIRTKAYGLASFAAGANTTASGDYSISMGNGSTSASDFSLTLGKYLSSEAEGAVSIGSGYDINSMLVNTKVNSLMVGFRSKYPTLYVSSSPSIVSTGRVGIGNVTNPQAKLHIRADQREEASMFIEQSDFIQASIYLGNTAHGMESSAEEGLAFHTETNYLFNEGNVGIGTDNPVFDLEVQGKTFTHHFTLFDPELYQEDISGWILRSDSRGRAVWSDPALLSDADWEIKGDNIYRMGGKVGIGTSSPVAQLDLADVYTAGGMNLKIGDDAYLTDIDRGHIIGLYSQSEQAIGGIKLGAAGPLLFGRDQKLGIGTKEPSTSLEISRSLEEGSNVGMCITNPGTYGWFIGMDGNQKYINDLLIGGSGNLGSGLSSFMVIKQNGEVGLGTNETYGYKLAVNGAILTEEVTVKVRESWPDYVFKDDYDLLPLEDLESYILQHGHLPEIPAQEEVYAEGLKIGEMERLLLKKVEELTLYLIRQQAVINKLKEKVEKSDEQ